MLQEEGWELGPLTRLLDQKGAVSRISHPHMPTPISSLILAVTDPDELDVYWRRVVAEELMELGPDAATGFLRLKPLEGQNQIQAGFALGLTFRGQTLSATGTLADLPRILLNELSAVRDRATKFGFPGPRGDADTTDAQTAVQGRVVSDDLAAASDGIPARPGLGFDRIAIAMVKLVDSVVAGAREDESRDDSLVTIGIFGAWGAGKSTLMRTIRDHLPKERYLSVSVNPWKIADNDTLSGHFRDRTLDQLPTLIPGIRSRVITRAWLWLSNLPWVWGSLLIVVLFLSAVLIDSSTRWQVVPDLAKAWSAAKAGDGIDAIARVFDAHGVGAGASVVTILATLLWLGAKCAPLLWRGVKAKLQLAAAGESSTNLQSLYRDLAKFLRSDNRTLVFFVDDLDRCAPSRVAEFVESIHSLTAAGCIVFLACDEEYVAAALTARYKDVVAHHRDGKGFGRGFLAKIVQVPFRVPTIDEVGARSIAFVSEGDADSPAISTVFSSAAPSHVSIIHGQTRRKTEGLPEARLSAILDEVVGVFVRPLGLNIRFLKSLVSTVKLQLDIGGFTNEADAKRLAAAVFADTVDPIWLDAHALREPPPEDSPLTLHSGLVKRLKEAIGNDENELRGTYQRLGRRPRPTRREQTAAI
jgi:hypothetical protein